MPAQVADMIFFIQIKIIYILQKVTKNIEPYLGGVKHITTNGIGDLFVSKEILDMISRFKPTRSDFSMFIETNGVLFKDNWHKLEHLATYPITVSVTPNSFDRETYKYLAGRDDLAKFEESMSFITDLKHSGKISRIRMIMVIQDSNFRQVPDFIARCIDYDADDIVLRPIYHWFGSSEDDILYKNVLNPCHPYHKEYLQILENPLCRDPRILNWGFNVPQEAVPFPTLAMKRRLEGLDEVFKHYDCRLDEMANSITHIGCRLDEMANSIGQLSRYPKWLVNLGACFIPKKKNRDHLRDKYSR